MVLAPVCVTISFDVAWCLDEGKVKMNHLKKRPELCHVKLSEIVSYGTPCDLCVLVLVYALNPKP